jgi:hypothetical protein
MTPQEEIRSIMLKNGLSYQWIADRLGTYYQKIQYAIEIQREIPLSLYTAIMKIFERHGFIEGSEEKCQDLIELTFKSNSSIAEDLRSMNKHISEDIRDGKLTPDERLKLRIRLEDIKTDLDDTLTKLIKLTESGEG